MPDGLPYAVPITYAYDGNAFYSYRADGMKLAALRANPRACISVAGTAGVVYRIAIERITGRTSSSLERRS